MTTEINEKHLLLLADGLEKVPQSQFDMHEYRQREKDSGEFTVCTFVSKNDCGTIGCALGHAPLIPGLEPIKDDFNCHANGDLINLMWDRYCMRVFGIASRYINSPAWTFLFYGRWRHFDNTPQGAAKRIRFLVKHGRPPVDRLEYASEFNEALKVYEKELEE